MRKFIIIICCVCTITSYSQKDEPLIITEDIDHFWTAFDKIIAAKDSIQQYIYINSYIENGSLGLKKIMIARRYSPKSYIDAINNYPQFWHSIRQNTLKSKRIGKDLEAGIGKLRQVYPELKPAKIYFTIGAFKTPGTILEGSVLIGSEMALGDANVITTEFPPSLDFFKNYLKGNPISEIVFLNLHEYIHIQQNTDGGYDLLSQSLFEGIAEFIPVVALGKKSPTPAVSYGKANDQQIKEAFSKEMFAPWHYNWLYNNLENQFKVRDLGYYVGYAIAEKYYTESENKKEAVKILIGLDYNTPHSIENFVDQTKYFNKSIIQLKDDFENSRPEVVSIRPFRNGDLHVDAATTSITVTFSAKMDKKFKSTDFGALGKEFCPKIISAVFSEDGKSVIYQVEIEPNKRYQFVIANGFRNEKAVPLKPFVIDFETNK
jgi:hypothetical protein